MKFASKHDAQLFLIEIEMIDKISEIDESFEPTKEMLELFIQKRKTLIPGLRNFRKSQQTKQQWRHNRYKLLKGIRRFHKSTKGKRMHRALGRFIATRDSQKGIIKQASESLDFMELAETCKSISSLRTHIWIEHEYYHPLDEHVDFCEASEQLMNAVSRIENQILALDHNFFEEDLDILGRFIDENAIVNYINGLDENNTDFEKLKNRFDELKGLEKYSYVELVDKLKSEAQSTS